MFIMYNRLAELSVEILQSLIGEGEVIFTDMDAYELSCKLGVEPNKKDIYELKLYYPAICFAGNAMEFNDKLYWGGLSHLFGNIVYFPDNLIKMLWNNNAFPREGYPEEKIYDRLYKGWLRIVAHERRHRVQPKKLFVIDDNAVVKGEQTDAYRKQPHEADAEAFANAVLRGEATLDEVATWHTENWK